MHYAGVGCEMDAIGGAAAHGIDVIEDNAHGLFARLSRPALGTRAPCHPELPRDEERDVRRRWALLVNDARYVERAEILREKGTNRSGSSAARSTSTRGWTSARAT